MKSKLLRVIISFALILSLSLGCLAASAGNALYRDFGSELLYPLGHAGVVYLVDSAGRPTYIVP